MKTNRCNKTLSRLRNRLIKDDKSGGRKREKNTEDEQKQTDVGRQDRRKKETNKQTNKKEKWEGKK